MPRWFSCSQLSVASWFVFFFQAEDGIRDDLVTGVQTCALPIWQKSCSSNFQDNFITKNVRREVFYSAVRVCAIAAIAQQRQINLKKGSAGRRGYSVRAVRFFWREWSVGKVAGPEFARRAHCRGLSRMPRKRFAARQANDHQCRR